METSSLKNKGKYTKGIDENNIWYKYNNHNSDIVTVFIHGLGGSSYPFEKFQDLFSQNNKSSLLIDLRGHGFSEKSKLKNYDIHDYAHDVLSIMKTENITKANLVGHCFGGMVSMKLLEIKPELVNTLTLVSTNHKPDREMKSFVMKEFLVLVDEIFAKTSPNLYDMKMLREFDYSVFEKESDIYLPRMIKDFEDTSIEVMIHTLESIFSNDFESIIKDTNKPTFIIHGKKDSIFNYRVAEKMNSLIKNSDIQIRENDNHVSHIIDPETDLHQVIYSFINTNS